MIFKKILSTVLVFSIIMSVSAQSTKGLTITSPDGKLKIEVLLNDKITYTVSHSGTVLLENNSAALLLRKEVLGVNPVLKNVRKVIVDNVIQPLIPMKYARVENKYNETTLNFKNDYSLQFRAYDDGFAYRFITHKKNEIEVVDENATLNFKSDYRLHLQEVRRTFDSPYEEPYLHINSSEFNPDNKMSTLPILIEANENYKILFSEANLFDYPAMFIKGNSALGVSGAFPKNPIRQEYNGKDNIIIKEEADYIAKTSGKRSFPWRFMIIATEESKIIENSMVCKLADPCKIQNPTWIQSGQTVWDWWNYATPHQVDFVAGRNQDTYTYFIDFAAENNIPYSLIDEGWANSRKEPFTANPDVNMPQLAAYAKSKNVKLILWMHWTAVENNIDTLFKIYKEWGISGIKIDFMARSDQWMVNFYERVAKEAAANNCIVLFHGSFKPAGLEYVYPNVLSYEGVRGLEWKEKATADNNLYLPFMRNAVGPMDFTPGAMVSMQPEYYVTSKYNPVAIGTRAMQLAHFVVFESGIQMLADNPSQYMKETDCFDFIKQTPVTWDETKVLAAKIDQYVVVAKRKGDKWYVGAITNSKQNERRITIDFNFLNRDKTYTMTSYEDGMNADKVAIDYKKRISNVDKNGQLEIKLVKNGGWAAILE